MRLKKDSFVVRVAFWDKKPDQASLCALFWRFVFGIIPYAFFGTLGYLIIIPLMYIIAPFFGCTFKLNSSTPFVPIRSWPRIRGRRLLPFPILFVSVLVGGLAYGIWGLCGATYRHADDIAQFCSSNKNLGIIAVVSCTLLLVVLAVRFFRSETWDVCCEWMRARKERICPIVMIDD